MMSRRELLEVVLKRESSLEGFQWYRKQADLALHHPRHAREMSRRREVPGNKVKGGSCAVVAWCAVSWYRG